MAGGCADDGADACEEVGAPAGAEAGWGFFVVIRSVEGVLVTFKVKRLRFLAVEKTLKKLYVHGQFLIIGPGARPFGL